MDPNELLTTIRVTLDALSSGSLSFIEQIEASERLRVAVQALDRWLAGGGELPDAWQQREAVLT